MITLLLTRTVYDRATAEFGVEPVARIQVYDGSLEVMDGDPSWNHIRDTVVDHPRTGEDLHFEDDPELWARTLPASFRSGELIAEAIEGAAVAAPPIEVAGRR